MKKSLSVLLVVLMLSLLCCGSLAETASAQEHTPVELNYLWWGGQDRAERTMAVCKLFTEKYPWITFATEFVPPTEINDVTATRAAAGIMPDVIQVNYTNFNIYAESGTIVNLEKYIESGLFDVSDIDEQYLSGGRVNGDLYAVNIGANCPAMFYDVDVVTAAGVEITEEMTWDDFIKAAETIYAKTGVKTAFYFTTPDCELVRNAIRGAGLSILNEAQDDLGFEDEGLVLKAFELLEYVSRQEWACPPESFLVGTLEGEPIVTGDAWNTFIYSSQVTQLVSLIGAERKVGAVPYPDFADSVSTDSFVKPGQLMAVGAHGSQEKQDAAMMFIDFFTNSVEANRILNAERGVPINTTVRNTMLAEINEVTAIGFDVVDYVGSHGTAPSDPMGAIKSELGALDQKVYMEVMYGEKTAAEAAETWLANLRRLIGQ